jgi:hypothetical protein
VSEVSPSKDVRKEKENQADTVKVKDVKQKGGKSNERRYRPFRIIRKFGHDARKQREYSRLVNNLQSYALRSPLNFITSLQRKTELNDVDTLVLSMVKHDQLLFTDDIKKQANGLLLEREAPTVGSSTLKKVICYETTLPTLLTILNLCRQYDGKNPE